MSEDIVEKVRHVIRVPLGLEQKRVYEYHLHADYLTEEGKINFGAKLQALRIAAANPCSALLKGVGDGRPTGGFRSSQSFIPKLASALRLIDQILRRNEQVIVFSAFNSSLDALAERLSAASVRHLVLDGRVRPRSRGRLAAQFKTGDVPIMLAGVDSMAEMHSFSNCSNCILLAYSWAWDKFEQAINRIHRINSPKPVNVYSIICDGTIDRRLEELLNEKADSAELVIDGQLRQELHAEISLADLLDVAAREFDPATHTLDEAALESEWVAGRVSLQSAAVKWR